MRLFRFVSTWVGDHPVGAVFLAILLVCLLIASLPMILALLPIRRVPFRYNLRNLQVRWRTTLVTGLAFTFVTALLTIMLSFVTGMNRLTDGSGHPGNVVVLSDGATDEAFSKLPYISTEELPDKLQRMIEKTGDDFLVSREVYVVVVHTIPNAVEGGKQRRFVQMRGLFNAQISAAVHDIELTEGGNWPSPAGVRLVKVKKDGSEVQATATEIVVGDGIARTLAADLGKEILEPGDVVEIGTNRLWVVTGVMKAGTNTFGSEIWARHTVVQETFGRNNPPTYTAYVVRTSSAALAELAAVELKNFKTLGNLQATPERQYYAKLSETNRQFSVAIWGVAVVMAIGGMLGIANTMFAAISQRTKDIGVLRLMGYRRWHVFMTFQLESLVIALVGGVLGVGIGYLLADGRTATSIVSTGVGGGGKSVVLKLTVDAMVVASGLIFSLFMGAIGGIVPSFNAMRTRPLDSLK
jgi:putative ABC transport system permease protein